MTENINICSLKVDQIDILQSLWEGLKEHHRQNSTYFTERYQNSSFEKRKEALLAKAKNGKLNIDIAKDKSLNMIIAYCISSAFDESQGRKGEIDSIFIKEEYRGKGIGDRLMKLALEWLEKEKVTEKRIVVAEGNENVFKFYQKYGFYHLHNILQQKE